MARLMLKLQGIFIYDKIWSASKESDEEWGIEFRKIVILLLMIRKSMQKTIPKPIIFLILSFLSGMFIDDKSVPWEKDPKSNTEPQKSIPTNNNQNPCSIN